MKICIKYYSILFIIFFTLFSCTKDSEAQISVDTSHLKYFGFTLVDTYWDDPTDAIAKTNYIDEVASFCNVADILVVNPTDHIIQRMNDVYQLDMQSILHLNEIFFEVVGTNSESGTDYDLRVDYQQRWDDFVATNQLHTNQHLINVFYIGEEPTWNGISFDELKLATDYVKSKFPTIPIMVIEAYPILNNFKVPITVDWIGFDHYFVKDPNTNSDFQQEFALLITKLTDPDQKLVVIMDSHYISWAHGTVGNIELIEMKEVAQNYYNLAKSEPKVIAMLGYFWPNGFDFPEAIGARGMPQIVQDEYIKIGKEITAKH